MSDAAEIKYCRQCEKQLYGRSDQVYCNDTCRNTFNKKKARREKMKPHPNQKAIFKIIQRNYELLKSLNKNENHTFKDFPIPKTLLGVDFNPNYFTSIITDRWGTWSVCFDRGWLEREDTFIITDFPDKGVI